MKGAVHQVIATTLCVGSLLWTLNAKAEAWPTLKFPDNAKVQTVADDMVLNGTRARVMRFEFRGDEADVVEFYRQQFGARRVENKVAGMLVVATQQADFFHTVQLKTLQPGKVQGTVMTNRVQGGAAGHAAAGGAAGGGRSAVALDTEKLLPPDSAVLSQMQSVDAGKQSMLMVAANKASAQANRDHVLLALQGRGFRLVKDDQNTAAGRPAFALMLASPDEEAMVTVTDAGPYRAVLINRTRDAK